MGRNREPDGDEFAPRVAAHYQAGKSGGVLTTSGTVTPAASVSLNVLSRSGNDLTLYRTPDGGTLQTTPTLLNVSNVWNPVGTANPATIRIGTGAGFYRVKQ